MSHEARIFIGQDQQIIRSDPLQRVVIFVSMAGNTLGSHLRLTTFGESHGNSIGGIIDGLPAGVEIDSEAVAFELSRRKPGQSKLTTSRSESDQVEWLSGLWQGKTTGSPLAFRIANKDARSQDYDKMQDVYRPGHADRTYQEKYGIRDPRGGGRSSARETANWVVAGAIARHLLPSTLKCIAYVDQVGTIHAPALSTTPDAAKVEAHSVRCPDEATAQKMQELIERTKKKGDSVGGAIRCVVTAAPAGLGEPVFGKLPARLGAALFSLNAVKGVEFGSGFQAASMFGSTHNDTYDAKGEPISNHAGGSLGGLSTGAPIEFRVAFKPTSTIGKSQQTIDRSGQVVQLEAKGRHDPCVVPRAVPIVEALTLFTLADLYLISKTDRL